MTDLVNEKLCGTCSETKPLSAFHTRRLSRRRKDGTSFIYVHVSTTCKGCEHQAKTDWRKTPEAKESERLFRQTNEKHRTYRQTEAGRATTRRYLASLKGLLRQSRSDYKARGGTGPITLTAEELSQILDRYRMTCAYCRVALDREAEVGESFKFTLDHVVPIDRGGAHSHDNVVPACLRCNQRKSRQRLIPLPPPQADTRHSQPTAPSPESLRV